MCGTHVQPLLRGTELNREACFARPRLFLFEIAVCSCLRADRAVGLGSKAGKEMDTQTRPEGSLRFRSEVTMANVAAPSAPCV